MKTNVVKCICPNCGAVDCQDLLTYSLVDTIVTVMNKCSECKKAWTDNYGLFYLGYADESGSYDYDGLKIRY